MMECKDKSTNFLTVQLYWNFKIKDSMVQSVTNNLRVHHFIQIQSVSTLAERSVSTKIYESNLVFPNF